MYIKFCRNYGADKKDEAGENLSSESKLSVELEGDKGSRTQGNVLLYRAVCLSLSIICLVLLLVVVILGVKLQTGSKACAEIKETTPGEKKIPSIVQACSFEQCQTQFPQVLPPQTGCQRCDDGWLRLNQSCFFLSTFRLSWDKSQRNCTARGGSLAVITSQGLQSFLTKEGRLKYWIGLRNQGATWTWVNNTVLQQSYWADVQSEGDCGILSSESPHEKNWVKASCQSYTYFICQIQL